MTQSHILVVDDEPDIRELVQEILEDEGYTVTPAENGEAARAAFASQSPDLVLLDIWMPDIDGITLLKEWSAGSGLACPVVVMSGHGTLETAIEATKLGAFDFVQKPLSLARLLSIVSKAIESGRSKPRSAASADAASTEPTGNSAVMQVLRGKAEQAAGQDLPVLITGEKGSGRENLARFIHDISARDGDFVIMDHFELQSDSLLSYLLGEGDGDARTAGVFERAEAGTLFIPDIEDLPEGAQRAINRVLDTGQITPDDGQPARALDVRLISSAAESLLNTSRDKQDLQQLVYRLNVLPLVVPPLRERPDDIPELVRYYADWFPNHENLPYRPFSVAAQNRLRNHSWPGNIRQLKNLVQQLLVLGGEGEVTANEVDEALKHSPAQASGSSGDTPRFFDLPLREAREQFEREYLIFKLRETRGSVGRLAEAVGMERTHLYRKLRALGIDPKTAGRGGEE